MTFYSQLKHWLLGQPLPTSAYEEERLSNAAALAVLSSDALSSVAYATEEILLVLVLAGSAAISLALPIAIAIVLLLGIIALSYRQTIRAYPKGGGAYIVARENLGIYPGLIAAASLMIDYILTVTVSVSAGIAALISAIPALQPLAVELCLGLIFLLMVANLRGLRSSGQIFTLPTYAFIFSILVLIVVGIFRQATGQVVPVATQIEATTSLSLFFICRAFAAGCTALTGVEAISDGVLAFKAPEWQNARRTLLYMVVILGTMFLGITYLTRIYQIVPQTEETVLSVLGREILGTGWLYYGLQGATLLILLLAANTSFSDFPRLCYFLSRDHFLPRQLLLLGDRLVYSNGIILLSICAAFLVVIFQAQVNAIIPLYAVGVFTSFTLSQGGMVRHWFVERGSRWLISAGVNGFGAMITAIVLGIIVTTKFSQGAWLVIIAIPCVVSLFLAINRYYQKMEKCLSIVGVEPRNYSQRPKIEEVTHPAVVFVGQLHQGTLQALNYARSIADEIVAVHVDLGEADREALKQQWQQLESDIPLVILDSPYRSVVAPLSEFVAQHLGGFSTIIIPVFVTRHWWEDLLHNHTALFLRQSLRTKHSPHLGYFSHYLWLYSHDRV
ncbi:MAG: APC family permease [Spirulinaceae cyanobacterium]